MTLDSVWYQTEDRVSSRHKKFRWNLKEEPGENRALEPGSVSTPKQTIGRSTGEGTGAKSLDARCQEAGACMSTLTDVRLDVKQRFACGLQDADLL